MSKQEEIVGKPISDAIGGEMAEEKEVPKKLSRKDFVKGAAAVAGAGALASCAPAATPAPEAAPTCPPAEECAPCPTPAAAAEAGPVTLEVYNPSGAFEVTEVHAGRLDTLEGKTICELSNRSWQADRSFPLIRELLQEMYPTLTIIPYTEFPNGTSGSAPNGGYIIDMDETANLVKAAGCDAVILGNAG